VLLLYSLLVLHDVCDGHNLVERDIVILIRGHEHKYILFTQFIVLFERQL
jgi:hypothetical protein